MNQQTKLQLFCKVMRFLILLSAAIVAISLVIEYWFGVSEFEWGYGDQHYSYDFTIDFNKKYHDLRQMPDVNQWLLSLYPLTFIAIQFLTLYWLQRLFGFYAKGQFFHKATTHCYFVLIWTAIVRFVLEYYQEYILWLFHPNKTNLGIQAHADFSQLLLLLILLAVAYVLKMANQLDKENKEFV